MVVTDLHGDWDAYQRYRDRFIDLQAKGQIDFLILTGDLIHRYSLRRPDQSLEIVLDVIALQEKFGEAVICLSGNHELPHIYGISLAKGRRIFTPQFEEILTTSQTREVVIPFFHSLPFYLRTKAGVTITHAGASPNQGPDLYHWDHQELLSWSDTALEKGNLEFLRNSYASRHQLPYEVLAKGYLSVSGPDDPRYNDLLRGFVATTNASFDRILWPALFTRCEEEYGAAKYSSILEKALLDLSNDFHRQRVLVAGHMDTEGGYQVVSKYHVRLSSGRHAHPREAGRYLVFDAATPINNARDLLDGRLGTVF
ncbi:MAG: metallophosphoesterase [Anaerolineae bacterium]|nr:metallophosphoesterase [Anaerolineae bacterium]